jgi:coproporphyrinogen III oxidase-like Fe-S oxidoreductase
MNAGWPWEAFRSATGFELREEWAEEMLALERRGWGVRETDRFRLTPAGLRFADAAGSEFLRPDDATRIALGNQGARRAVAALAG